MRTTQRDIEEDDWVVLESLGHGGGQGTIPVTRPFMSTLLDDVSWIALHGSSGAGFSPQRVVFVQLGCAETSRAEAPKMSLDWLSVVERKMAFARSP